MYIGIQYNKDFYLLHYLHKSGCCEVSESTIEIHVFTSNIFFGIYVGLQKGRLFSGFIKVNFNLLLSRLLGGRLLGSRLLCCLGLLGGFGLLSSSWHTGEFPMGVGHRVENGWGLTKVAVVLLNGLIW